MAAVVLATVQSARSEKTEGDAAVQACYVSSVVRCFFGSLLVALGVIVVAAPKTATSGTWNHGTSIGVASSDTLSDDIPVDDLQLDVVCIAAPPPPPAQTRVTLVTLCARGFDAAFCVSPLARAPKTSPPA